MAKQEQNKKDELLRDISTDWYSQGNQRSPNFLDIKHLQNKRSVVSGFSNPNTQRIARGVLEAEHRGTDPAFNKSDMYIRTKHAPKAGSSAYGPGQITMNTAMDIAERGNLSPEAKKYVMERFIPAGKKMLYHGKMKGKIKDYDPNYDYGGQAGLNVESEYPLYNELWAATINRKLRDAGVTSDQVLEGGDAMNKFLSRYYRPNNRGDYDPAFLRGIEPRKKPNTFMNMVRLQRMSPKPRWAD